jgi:hypothetical protein
MAAAADSAYSAAASAAAQAQMQQQQQQEEQEGAQPLRFDSLSPKEFIALADMYIGGLWTRIERGLREAEGEASSAAVRGRHSCRSSRFSACGWPTAHGAPPFASAPACRILTIKSSQTAAPCG